MAIAVDSSKCSGCRACQLICALEHFKENNPKKAALRIVPQMPSPGGYKVNFCTQCGVCKDVCPTDAIYEKAGIHFINADDCNGCMICVEECPQECMVVHPDSIVPNLCNWCEQCAKYCGTAAIYINGANKKEGPE